jgi:hypothetical protein
MAMALTAPAAEGQAYDSKASVSSLSPSVELLLMAPVRHHLPHHHASSDCVERPPAAPAPEDATTPAYGGWLNVDDGSFNWAMLDAFVAGPEEARVPAPLPFVHHRHERRHIVSLLSAPSHEQQDEEVMARMRAILDEKLAEQAAKASQSKPHAAPETSEAAAAAAAAAASGQGRGWARGGRGGQPQSGNRRGKGRGNPGGDSGPSQTQMEREIAALEREEGQQDADAPGGGAGGEREKKLSEEARAHDLAQWEHIVRTALTLQKAAPHVHRCTSFPHARLVGVPLTRWLTDGWAYNPGS